MRDVGGNGFDVMANFKVVPEPISLTQFGLLGASVLAHCAWRRRRPMALTEIRRKKLPGRSGTMQFICGTAITINQGRG